MITVEQLRELTAIQAEDALWDPRTVTEAYVVQGLRYPRKTQIIDSLSEYSHRYWTEIAIRVVEKIRRLEAQVRHSPVDGEVDGVS